MPMSKAIIIVIFILFTCSIKKSLSSSWDEYCQSDYCDSDSEFTSEEAVREYIERYGIDRLDDFIKARLYDNHDISLKIAVTGVSGSGKSMLINTLRGLTPNDIGAAELGSIETTKEIARYSHPEHRNLKFYDLPGVGTPDFPKEKYLKMIDYMRYDFFFIVSSKRFTEHDLWLSQELQAQGKNFFFIRSKVDEDLMNEKRDHPTTFNEEQILDKIREDCLRNIHEVAPKANVFVLSGLLQNTNKFDYGRMETTLIASFPAYKREALLRRMTMLSKEGIEAKVKFLKSQAWMIGILSGGVTAIPVPGVSLVIDYMLISSTIASYMEQLHLDEIHLRKWAKSYKISFDVIHKKLENNWYGSLLKNGVKNYVMNTIKEQLESKTLDKFMKYIPVVGSTLQALKTTQLTVSVLHKSLDNMLITAHFLIDQIK